MGGVKEPMKIRFVESLRVPICSHGHDKRVVGIAINNQCAVCRSVTSRDRNRKRRGWQGTDSSEAIYIKNLKTIRKELGLSVEEFCEYLQIPKGTYYGLQNQRRRAGKDIQVKVLYGVRRALADHRQKKAMESGYYTGIGGA